MVFLRAVTPALCELMDAAVSHAGATATTANEVRCFVEERLRHLVHTQTPSQLDTALWVFLIAQQQLLSRRSSNADTAADTVPSLPESLRLPFSITTIQDAVCWYAGELEASATPAEDEGRGTASPAATLTTAQADASTSNRAEEKNDGEADGGAGSAPEKKATAKKPATFRLFGSHTTPASATRRGDLLFDELIRHRHQPANPAASTPPPPTSSLPPQAAAAAAEAAASSSPSSPPPSSSSLPTGPLATVQLALAALSNAKRAAALRQPRSLVLVVRDCVSLWSLVFLCRQLRAHQLRKEAMLKGTAAAESPAGRHRGEETKEEGQGVSSAAPLSVCFHDYELLLPWDLVCAALSSHAETEKEGADKGEEAGEVAALTMAAVAAQCRARERSTPHRRLCHAANSPKTTSAPQQQQPLALIINPAVTAIDDNPDRLRKNARIDAIDEAANKYYYSLLATQAHGQTSGAGARSGNSATITGASSAAAHQEALRTSLAAVDLGDYGVLDPSRMRAPVPLSSTTPGTTPFSATTAASMTASGFANPERAAKSYAMFLRDASIGFDIQIMALTGAGVGYYMGYLRGLSTEWCTLYAVVGLVTMMLVDAVLIMIRMGRHDEAVLKARRRILRQREKLEREGEKLVQAMERVATTHSNGGDKESGKSKQDGDAVEKEMPSVVVEEVDALTKKKQ